MASLAIALMAFFDSKPRLAIGLIRFIVKEAGPSREDAPFLLQQRFLGTKDSRRGSKLL